MCLYYTYYVLCWDGFKCIVTKREGSYLHTESSNPLNDPTLILNYCTTFRPPSSSPLGLSTDTCVYTRQIRSSPYTATKPTSPGSISFLPSVSHTQIQPKETFSYFIYRIFTLREPKLFFQNKILNRTSRPSSS
jgi:hypothetical protein